jgi:hypothetical protein
VLPSRSGSPSRSRPRRSRSEPAWCRRRGAARCEPQQKRAPRPTPPQGSLPQDHVGCYQTHAAQQAIGTDGAPVPGFAQHGAPRHNGRSLCGRATRCIDAFIMAKRGMKNEHEGSRVAHRNKARLPAWSHALWVIPAFTASFACAGSKPAPTALYEQHGRLACAGEEAAYEEELPELRRFSVRVACESERVVVQADGDRWSSTCVVDAEAGPEVWRAAGERRAWAELPSIKSRHTKDALCPEDGGSLPVAIFDEANLFGGGSCPCPWPGRPNGEHCWKDPCVPPAPPSTPAEPAPSPGDSCMRTTTAVHCVESYYVH